MQGNKHIIAALATALAFGFNASGRAQSSTPLPTDDGIEVAAVCDSAGNALSALPMDGTTASLTMRLAAAMGGVQTKYHAATRPITWI